MAANPLLEGKKTTAVGSRIRAAEYAKRAEADGRRDLAKLWWEADRNGWDDDNYDPIAATERNRKIAEAQRLR